jgi:IclR family acetate operon transcriptional repressor
MQKLQSIERAFEVLEFLSEAGSEPVRLGDLAQQVGLEAPTCARIVQTLVALGYATQVGRMAGYVAGPMVHVVADRCATRPDLVHRLRPDLEALAATLRETAVLAMLVGERRVSLLEIEGDRELIVRGSARQNPQPCGSATGRLLLAYEPETQWRRRFGTLGLPGVAWPEMTDVDAFVRQMAEIRSQGRYERPAPDGTVGIAMPVSTPEGSLLAVGISVPQTRYEAGHRQQIHTELTRTAAAMAAVLAAADNARKRSC